MVVDPEGRVIAEAKRWNKDLKECNESMMRLTTNG
jgi:hypothetical protein